MPKATTADVLARPCPKCEAGPGARCRNHKGRPCKAHKERKRRHVPNVRPIEEYRESEASRLEKRHSAIRAYMEAVSKCGAGAIAYARYRYHDRTGALPDVVVPVCRRKQWVGVGWRMSDGRKPEEVMPFLEERMGPPFAAFYSHKPGGDDTPGGFGFRWETRFEFIEIPDVRTAEELQAAARKRRDKELNRQAGEAERLAEWKRRNVPPSLFDTALEGAGNER